MCYGRADGMQDVMQLDPLKVLRVRFRLPLATPSQFS
jgi:hypothetical protein